MPVRNGFSFVTVAGIVAVGRDGTRLAAIAVAAGCGVEEAEVRRLVGRDLRGDQPQVGGAERFDRTEVGLDERRLQRDAGVQQRLAALQHGCRDLELHWSARRLRSERARQERLVGLFVLQRGDEVVLVLQLRVR